MEVCFCLNVKEKGKLAVQATPVKRTKREKKVYTLAGQKHDPPEEVHVQIDFHLIFLCISTLNYHVSIICLFVHRENP